MVSEHKHESILKINNLMIVGKITTANQLWNKIIYDMDRMVYSSSVGTNVQRVVSNASFGINQYFAELNTRHGILKEYAINMPAHYRHCEVVYQNLYLEMYNLLGKSSTKIHIDGHSRNNVPLDPNSSLNYLQTEKVSISLVLENESVSKYPISTLKSTVRDIDEKMATFEKIFNQEVDLIHEKLLIPDYDEALLTELLSLLETNLTSIRSSIIIMVDQNNDVKLTYQRCSELIYILKDLLSIIRNEEKNVTIMRDNIIVKFMVSTELYRNMTHTFYVTQSTLASPDIKPLF